MTSADPKDAHPCEPPHVLVIVAVDAEREALGSACLSSPDVRVLVSGIGRTNAAATTAVALAQHPGFRAVINAGIAGSLPGSHLGIGDGVVATACVYAEEGVLTPSGFHDTHSLGFPLGPFEGNHVPVGEELLKAFAHLGRCAPVATVATCSGTDALAHDIMERTGAIAEAMEGAAVVHAALRVGVPGIELRTISNATGDRTMQAWDIPRALQALGPMGDAIAAFAAATRTRQSPA